MSEHSFVPVSKKSVGKAKLRKGYRPWYCIKCDSIIAFPEFWDVRDVNREMSYGSSLPCVEGIGEMWTPDKEAIDDPNKIILPDDLN